MIEQKTLTSPARLCGVGLHTGQEVHVEMVPAEPDTGIVFLRTDLPGRPRVEARVENLAARPRRTALVKAEAEVHTTEHLLAALFGAGVHNAEVWLDAPELPGLDGSALPYYEAIRAAGVESQGRPARELRLGTPLVVADRGASLVAFSRDDGLSVGYTLDYGARRGRGEGASFAESLSTQYLEIEMKEDVFAREIAPARTFVLEEEIRQLQAEGLGRGASTANTLVLGKDGIIGNQLRFRDEFVRHKMLDLLGDLYLTGCHVHGRLLATKSGHALNVRMARLILESCGRGEEHGGGPAGGARELPAVENLLPHRCPFLLVDSILEIDAGTRAVGLKSVAPNEGFFHGHFPGPAVMSGALIVEAMAQLAGMLLRKKPEYADRVPLLLALERVKFQRPVVPGDQLILEVTVKRSKPAGAEVKARASVDGVTAAEADIEFVLGEPGPPQGEKRLFPSKGS